VTATRRRASFPSSSLLIDKAGRDVAEKLASLRPSFGNLKFFHGSGTISERMRKRDGK